MTPVILPILTFIWRPMLPPSSAPNECPIICIFFGFTPFFTISSKMLATNLPIVDMSATANG